MCQRTCIRRAFKFSQAFVRISRASVTRIQVQKGARRLTDPLGAQTLTAYLIVKNTSDAIRFYGKAWGQGAIED